MKIKWDVWWRTNNFRIFDTYWNEWNIDLILRCLLICFFFGLELLFWVLSWVLDTKVSKNCVRRLNTSEIAPTHVLYLKRWFFFILKILFNIREKYWKIERKKKGKYLIYKSYLRFQTCEFQTIHCWRQSGSVLNYQSICVWKKKRWFSFQLYVFDESLGIRFRHTCRVC